MSCKRLTIITMDSGLSRVIHCHSYQLMLYALLFGSKLGFSRILDSLWTALWRCSHVRK